MKKLSEARTGCKVKLANLYNGISSENRYLEQFLSRPQYYVRIKANNWMSLAGLPMKMQQSRSFFCQHGPRLKCTVLHVIICCQKEEAREILVKMSEIYVAKC